MIVVECPICHRPVAELLLAGGRVIVSGSTYAENSDPSGTVTVHAARRRAWASRVHSADASLTPGSAAGAGRRTVTCHGRRHRQRWTLTEDAVAAGYHKAERAGRNRISVTELR